MIEAYGFSKHVEEAAIIGGHSWVATSRRCLSLGAESFDILREERSRRCTYRDLKYSEYCLLIQSCNDHEYRTIETIVQRKR